MLLDVRTYRCKPGTINTHLKLYSEKGKPAQSKHLGQPLLLQPLRQVIQMNILIYGYIKMLTTEKRKEQLCGLTQIGLITLKKVQN